MRLHKSLSIQDYTDSFFRLGEPTFYLRKSRKVEEIIRFTLSLPIINTSGRIDNGAHSNKLNDYFYQALNDKLI